jgi:hypothetical protein
MNILLSFIFTFCFAHQFDQYEWKVFKEKDNITVYKANSRHQSGLIPIRAKSVINHPLAKVISAMSDSDRKHEWIPRLVKNEIVEQTSPFSRVEYSLYTAPWPLMDRSFLIEIVGNYIKEKKMLVITIKSVERKDYPEEKNYIRGITHLGRIELIKLGPNKTSFETWLITDFKGGIPNWIINIIQSKWPFRMLDRLNKQLNKPDIVVLDKYKPLLD